MCRIRPGSDLSVRPLNSESVKCETTKKEFQFDKVFPPSANQGNPNSLLTSEMIFEEVKPLVTSFLDGYNICLMAYGQTGSGKTHSMVYFVFF